MGMTFGNEGVEYVGVGWCVKTNIVQWNRKETHGGEIWDEYSEMRVKFKRKIIFENGNSKMMGPKIEICESIRLINIYFEIQNLKGTKMKSVNL